jgi:hypothetical protein
MEITTGDIVIEGRQYFTDTQVSAMTNYSVGHLRNTRGRNSTTPSPFPYVRIAGRVLYPAEAVQGRWYER